MGGCKGWDAGTRASYQNSIFSHLNSGDRKPYYELFQHASMSGCISTSQEVYVDFLVQAMSRCVQKF